MDIRNLGPAAKAAVIFPILGFVIAIESTSVSSSGCSYTNIGALLFGVLSIGAGIGAAFEARGSENKIGFPIAAYAIGVGVLHIFRGIGAVGGPC